MKQSGGAAINGQNKTLASLHASPPGFCITCPCYWSWYGYSGRVAWCAIYVSWCADQCGFLDTGVIPRFEGVVAGVSWFQSLGQWQDRYYEPSPGDIIFFDWEPDNNCGHVGIVEKCENGIVYTIEGNSGDKCLQNRYYVGNSQIFGYGLPAY